MFIIFYKFYQVFVYLTIHDTIRYTIQKNEKSIHDTIHVLTVMVMTFISISTFHMNVCPFGAPIYIYFSLILVSHISHTFCQNFHA